MRCVIFALVVVASTPATAGGFSMPGSQHHGRAFWLNEQAWSAPKPRSEKPKPKFTTTYLDGVASRFAATAGSHGELFEQKLGGAYAPAFVATVDNGAPMLMLRWHPGE